MNRSFVPLMLAATLAIGACSVEVSPPGSEDRSSGSDASASRAPEGEPSDTSDISINQVDAPLQHSKTSEVVKRALPSIVNVKVTALTQGVLGPREGKGQGSGVIIDSEGIIITNNHVVQDATEVRVVFNDQEHDAMDGTVVGVDPERDLAVVQVKADDLTPIEIGRSDALELGDDVIAIGYPLGLGGVTVTKGIVSGQNRTIKIPVPDGETLRFTGLLQTDAAINPGNSGGALIDVNGRLIGVNSAAALAAAAENIGFAIEIDSALPVIEQILEEPLQEHAWLGVSVGDPEPAALDEFGLDEDAKGALVLEVLSGGPAEGVEMDIGDLITSIDDRRITSSDDLIDTLADLVPGDEVELTIISEGDGTRTETVELDQRPAQFGSAEE
nr:trypsin-like peptidase domain-containing protein [Actinomycetota bacterium]